VTTEHRPLAGKNAVVTGGCRGIGKMLTTGLLEAGAKVYISSRKQVDLDTAVTELSPLGDISAFAADLGTTHGVQALADHIAEREHAVHALFNNAGVNWGDRGQERPSAGARTPRIQRHRRPGQSCVLSHGRGTLG
jgi:NAD(P)-dependent dehydrogenase (short-subunit alcohol dehydrogenase family)